MGTSSPPLKAGWAWAQSIRAVLGSCLGWWEQGGTGKGHPEGWVLSQALWEEAPLNPTSVLSLPTLAPGVYMKTFSSSLQGQEGNPAILTTPIVLCKCCYEDLYGGHLYPEHCGLVSLGGQWQVWGCVEAKSTWSVRETGAHTLIP